MYQIRCQRQPKKGNPAAASLDERLNVSCRRRNNMFQNGIQGFANFRLSFEPVDGNCASIKYRNFFGFFE
jgi:hypothetical protein